MKVCKKCKNHVPNKAKICKKCGSDVSKAKIIKTANNGKSKSTMPKTQTNKNTIKKNKPVVEKSIKNKKEVVVTPKQDKKTKNDSVSSNKNKYLEKSKVVLLKVFNALKLGVIKLAFVLSKITVYVFLELYQSLKTAGKVIFKSSKEIGKFLYTIPVKTIKLIKRMFIFVKNRHEKAKLDKKNKPVEVEKIVIEEKSNVKKEKKPGRKALKYAFAFVFIFSIIGGVYFVGQDIYKDLTGTTNRVIVTEKATRDKVFNMDDIITYNNVDYKIVKVETSKGNNYKTPKPGHQFLIVTVYIKNNTGSKIPYSYENWTMSNSKGEEKKRVFTSINVDTAL